VKTLLHLTKKVAVVVILTAFLGVSIVAATKWAVDTFLRTTPTMKTTTQGFAPEIGNLTFSAALVSENEVLINLTVLGTGYIDNAGMIWTLWISDLPNGIIGAENLPEGLTLSEGSLEVNATCPLPNRFLSLQAKIQATADGKWGIFGRFVAAHGPGFSCSIYTYGIYITVLNGCVINIEKESETHLDIPDSGQMEEVNSTRRKY